MAEFRRLTGAGARSLTRAELLNRIEAEQQYWFRKRAMMPETHEAFCRLCHPPEPMPGSEIMNHLRLMHPGWDDPAPPVTDVTAPFRHLVMREADIEPHGALCSGCKRPFKVGDRYTGRLVAMIGDTPAVEPVCLGCAGKVGTGV